MILIGVQKHIQQKKTLVTTILTKDKTELKQLWLFKQRKHSI